jgi:hypothetical protein
VAEEITEKLVTQRAAQVPACVHACPHDAAIRVDERSQFPAVS